jgi:type III restriction enzyme
VKLQLKPFQEIAVTELRKRAELAREEIANGGDRQALLLSAPTGAGKTVIAAALLESLLDGDATYEPDPQATFLWLTDQPSLNKQTEKKFLAASDKFDESRIESVEPATFDQEIFDAGKLYFVNTQKLSRTSSLVLRGDERRFSLWETITATAAARPTSFWLILDEAHRGMGQSNGNSDRKTIVQRLILGESEYGLPPIPLIFAISATPERFTDLLEKARGRVPREVPIDVSFVRSSGLLKDIINLYHTDEKQPSDTSLLVAAGKKLVDYERAWRSYQRGNGGSDVVRPVLVVQVEDGSGKPGKTRLSKTDLEGAIQTLRATINDLTVDEIAHSFQGETAEAFGDSYTIRYLSPQDIESDQAVRVVFFKLSLTTGWDCPRAEVMMSFRRARDETLIAQLVGRMVRTPLAFSVSDPEVLASVALYLPEYDRESVKAVIERLERPNPDDGIPGTSARKGNDLVTLHRDKGCESVFAAVDGLPSYRVERVAKLSPVRRLLRLGDRLVWDGLDKTAKDRFERELLGVVGKERKRLARRADYKSRLADAANIDVRRVGVKVLVENGDTDESRERLAASGANVEQAFGQAGRKLAAGFHRVYLKARAAEPRAPDVGTIKRELWVIVSDNYALRAIERKAETLCERELTKFDARINNEVGDEERLEYRAVRQELATERSEPWSLPTEIEGSCDGVAYGKHLFVKEDGTYTHPGLNTLERETIEGELEKKETVGWLRNEDRRPWAFGISYEKGGEAATMYPDFLVFRRVGKHIVTDILEPHSMSQADSVGKVRGLANFAAKHGDRFGRIEFLDRVDGSLRRLDLRDPAMQQRAKTIEGIDSLRQLLGSA